MLSNNRFYNLPEVIQSEIYLYDPTYRMFGNQDFANELSTSFLTLKSTRHDCVKMITAQLDAIIYDGGSVWNNEYGRIDFNDDLDTSLPKYTSTDDFVVVLHPSVLGDAIYFKILPTSATEANCAFLRNPHNYDGYFIDNDANMSLDRLNTLDLMCIDDPLKYDTYDSNHRRIEKRIAMYFC